MMTTKWTPPPPHITPAPVPHRAAGLALHARP